MKLTVVMERKWNVKLVLIEGRIFEETIVLIQLTLPFIRWGVYKA